MLVLEKAISLHVCLLPSMVVVYSPARTQLNVVVIVILSPRACPTPPLAPSTVSVTLFPLVLTVAGRFPHT